MKGSPGLFFIFFFVVFSAPVQMKCWNYISGDSLFYYQYLSLSKTFYCDTQYDMMKSHLGNGFLAVKFTYIISDIHLFCYLVIGLSETGH